MIYYISIAIAALAAWYVNNLSTERAEHYIKGIEGASDVRPGSGRFFDRIAPTYDFLNEVISLGYHGKWRRAVIRKALPVKSVLDVSTGTGDLAISFATNRSMRVFALDPSTEMLAIARKKIAILGDAIGKVEFITGNVEELPFDKATFDAVTVAFGVRNFENRQKGLSEIARVLVPGGKLIILEISSPAAGGLLRWVSDIFVKHGLLFFAGLFSGDRAAYRYLGQSMDEFPDREVFEQMLNEAGFVITEYERLGPLKLGPELYSAWLPMGD